jgi:hypothetical protein
MIGHVSLFSIIAGTTTGLKKIQHHVVAKGIDMMKSNPNSLDFDLFQGWLR